MRDDRPKFWYEIHKSPLTQFSDSVVVHLLGGTEWTTACYASDLFSAPEIRFYSFGAT